MDPGQRFRESEEHELLEPYADDDGLVAGYRVEGLLSRDPWRHTTYEASTADGRRVALKLLNLRSGDSRRLTRRFERRLRLRASIEHPNLLPILDWGKAGDRYYLASPLSMAPTLADLLAAAPLKAKGALRLLAQLADALETAHERGLVHRDLAPEHVVVEPRGGGHVLLGDFGVADPEWSGGLLDLAGSTPYLSPETLREEPLVPESNVYSLACILVECLTGSPPYTSEHASTVAYAHVAEPPPRLSERHPELPASIDDVVAAAMAKDPAERLRSARQLLSAAAVSLGVQIPSPPVNGASARSRTQREPTSGIPAVGRLPPRGGESINGASVQEGSPLEPMFRAGDLRAALRRHPLAIALAVTVACGGAIGFLLGRSGDDATAPASNPALAAEREQSSDLQATDLVLERLDARRAVARRRLAEARTLRAQAAEAGRLAAAYGSASRILPRLARDATPVASALEEAGRAYGRLAAAAGRADREAYAAASGAVRRSEGDLDETILRLNRARSRAPTGG